MKNMIFTVVGFCVLGLLYATPALGQAATDVNCDGCVHTGDIATNGVRRADIQNFSINTPKLNNFAVTTAKIKTGAVTADKIADGAVTGNKIAIAAVGIDNINTSEVAMQRHVMLCGTSGRPAAAFIPGFPAIGLISGCSPTPTTIAMLVSRNGDELLEPTELQDFISAGGSVVGEWSNADELYNMVFNEAVIPGDFISSEGCNDYTQPQVRVGVGSPWDGIDHVAPVAGAGCGYDMTGWPGITVFGQWTGGQVSHAYRDLGAGRLWLVEQDWQDGAFRSDYQASRDLIGYMLTHVR